MLTNRLPVNNQTDRFCTTAIVFAGRSVYTTFLKPPLIVVPALISIPCRRRPEFQSQTKAAGIVSGLLEAAAQLQRFAFCSSTNSGAGFGQQGRDF